MAQAGQGSQSKRNLYDLSTSDWILVIPISFRTLWAHFRSKTTLPLHPLPFHPPIPTKLTSGSVPGINRSSPVLYFCPSLSFCRARMVLFEILPNRYPGKKGLEHLNPIASTVGRMYLAGGGEAMNGCGGGGGWTLRRWEWVTVLETELSRKGRRRVL